MPTVGDLNGVGEGLLSRQPVTAAAIPRDDADLRLGGEPDLGGGGLAVRKERNRLSPLKIADQRPIALVAAKPSRRSRSPTAAERWGATLAHRAQKSVVAHRDAKPAREARRRPASQRKRQTMDDLVEPSGAPRPGLENVVVEPLREDVSRAGRRLASKAASTENENDATPEIGKSARRRE